MARRRQKGGRRRGSGVAGILLLLLLLTGFLAAGAAWLVLTPYGPDTETFIAIAPASSATTIARKLEADGIVRTRYAFDLVRYLHRGRLQAGTYRFDHPIPVTDVYSQIARGEVYTKALTVPEGSNIFDIATRVEQSGLGTRGAFLAAAVKQTALIADLDPRAKSLEGYLFPDTYRFSPTVTAAQIAAAMVKRFRQVASELGLNQNVHQIVTMASLVERETAVDSERPLVASVFENRLQKKMPLMTDPAVVYGLEFSGKWRGMIYASDLKRDTPYNTYLHPGLPPGPIANPGLPSLRAAMEPAKTNYLYFVAAGVDAQGHSLFATTLDQHNHNVAEYRAAQKKAGER
jgi:UPF0755 protein